MFIIEGKGNYLAFVTNKAEPVLLLKTVNKKGDKEEKTLNLAEFTVIKGWKSQGNKLTSDTVKSIEDITPEPPVQEENNGSEEEIPFIIENNSLEEEDEDNSNEITSPNNDPPDKPVQINLF